MQLTISIWQIVAESYPKGVENTVRKGEIAHDEQFLLFLQCFLKTCIADM